MLRICLALPLALLASCKDEAPKTDPRPNVLLIVLDSVRADLVGAYEQLPDAIPHSPSPHLDRLAEQGTLVERAYASSSWTLPSHVSLLTGQPDMVHAVEMDGHRIPAEASLVSELLREAGYRTAGFYSGPYLDPGFGFGRGFDRYEACYGRGLERAHRNLQRQQERLADESAEGDSSRTALETYTMAQWELQQASHRDRSSRVVSDAVVAELKRAARDERPFFVFAHFFDPHYDYIPPSPHDAEFDPDYRGSLDATDFFRNPAIAPFDPTSPTGRRRVINERNLDHVRALYAGELAWADDEIGRILAALEATNAARNTLLIVTSDHGDEFFEHGSIGHRSTLYEELLRVPLIVRHAPDFPPGSRIETPVSSIEVMPTILLTGGIEPPAGLMGSGLQAILNEEAKPAPVLGRLVSTEEVLLPLDPASTSTSMGGARATRTTVREAYLYGTLKIERSRSWATLTENPPASAADSLEARLHGMSEAEDLRWIDLARSPEERTRDYSTDFHTPEAEEALAAYRRDYTALLEARATPGRGEVTQSVLTALAGLGYISQEARIGALPGEKLALPPPGAEAPAPVR